MGHAEENLMIFQTPWLQQNGPKTINNKTATELQLQK
jgi:hypothetical protein